MFCNYQTYVVRGDNPMEKSKVQGGKRVIYTSHHPCWDAKNRHGLPECLPLEYGSIGHLFGPPKEQKDEPSVSPLVAVVRANLVESGITEEQLRKVVGARSRYSEDTPLEQYSERFIAGWVLKYWTKIVDIIQAESTADTNGGK